MTISVAFENSVDVSVGMASSVLKRSTGRESSVLHLSVFGSFSEDALPIEEHLGDEIMARIGRVLEGRNHVVLGRLFLPCQITGSNMLRAACKPPCGKGIVRIFLNVVIRLVSKLSCSTMVIAHSSHDFFAHRNW